MNVFLRLGAYILHPLFIPLFGACLYYSLSPRYWESELVGIKLIAIAIVSVCIPMVTFFLLKNLGLVQSIHLRTVVERKFPLLVQCLLLLLLLKTVLDAFENPALYYFFVGMLFSSLTALLLVLFKIKVSLHQMGISGLTLFVLALSIYFKVNLLFWVGLFVFCNGWVASSRLHTASHNGRELVAGFFTGSVPQLLMLAYWL